MQINNYVSRFTFHVFILSMRKTRGKTKSATLCHDTAQRLLHLRFGTGGGNRTPDWSLEGSHVTTTPLPRCHYSTGLRSFRQDRMPVVH